MAEDDVENISATEDLSPERLQEILCDFEGQVNAPKDSISTLLLENDWSMIIKGHALIEGAVSFLLSEALDPRLRRVFTRVELGREDTGKLEFAKALGLLSSDERKFIKLVSNLRNLCAHDPSYLGFKLADYVKALDKQQRKNFETAVLFDITTEPGLSNWRKLVSDNPLAALGSAMMRIIVHVIGEGIELQRDKHLEQIHLDYAKAVLELNRMGNEDTDDKPT